MFLPLPERRPNSVNQVMKKQNRVRRNATTKLKPINPAFNLPHYPSVDSAECTYSVLALINKNSDVESLLALKRLMVGSLRELNARLLASSFIPGEVDLSFEKCSRN